VGLRTGLNFVERRKILLLPGLEPPSQWVPRALSPVVKRQGREADRSPSTSAEVKNVGSIPQLPPYVFIA
jgi:hypothetical protein